MRKTFLNGLAIAALAVTAAAEANGSDLWFTAPGGAVRVTEASDGILSRYGSYFEYGEYNEETPPSQFNIIFTANAAVRDFRYISFRDYDDDLNPFGESVLYSIDNFLPEKPFVAAFMQAGLFSYFGISYTDGHNARRSFIVRMNPADPEEEGYTPILLREYPRGAD